MTARNRLTFSEIYPTFYTYMFNYNAVAICHCLSRAWISDSMWEVEVYFFLLPVALLFITLVFSMTIPIAIITLLNFLVSTPFCRTKITTFLILFVIFYFTWRSNISLRLKQILGFRININKISIIIYWFYFLLQISA